MSATFHKLSSAACVPERSPREMNAAPLSLIAFSAATMSFDPLMPAGSLFGPTRMKSLYITGWRFTPKPSATNFSSCDLACTNTTSASPRLPVSSAWPVPCDTTFTSIPVFALNSGRMCPNRPESWVEVVDETTMDLSCAEAVPMRAVTSAAAGQKRRLNTGNLFELDDEVAAHERGGLR